MKNLKNEQYRLQVKVIKIYIFLIERPKTFILTLMHSSYWDMMLVAAHMGISQSKLKPHKHQTCLNTDSLLSVLTISPPWTPLPRKLGAYSARSTALSHSITRWFDHWTTSDGEGCF